MKREDTRDRQEMRISDYPKKRRIKGNLMNDLIRIRLEKKYETKTKTRVINGEKETEVKLEHNNVSNKGNIKRRYTYPNSPYGLVNNEWMWMNININREELIEEENE